MLPIDKNKDCCKEAWIAGANTSAKIFRQTIRDVRKSLGKEQFLHWLDGFCQKRSKDKK